MKITKTENMVQTNVVRVICDVCSNCQDAEYFKGVSIDKTMGYGSTIGDGARIQLDMCEKCLMSKLSSYIRVTQDEN
jgi:hypothetical protein